MFRTDLREIDIGDHSSRGSRPRILWMSLLPQTRRESRRNPSASSGGTNRPFSSSVSSPEVRAASLRGG
jgi:hypothetical protein